MLGNNKGIGLIEIVVAILIFGVGIIAALRMFPVTNASTTRSRNITIATNLAQEKLEELMGLPFGSASLTQGTHNDPLNPLQRHFTRTWSVVDDTPLAGMKRIDVTVSFPSSSSDSTVTLTTYITSKR